jgi:hypothetical protein
MCKPNHTSEIAQSRDLWRHTAEGELLVPTFGVCCRLMPIFGTKEGPTSLDPDHQESPL